MMSVGCCEWFSSYVIIAFIVTSATRAFSMTIVMTTTMAPKFLHHDLTCNEFFVVLSSWNRSFIMSPIFIFMNEYCSAGSCFFAAHQHDIDNMPPGHTYKDPGIGRKRLRVVIIIWSSSSFQ